ncbi:MAG: hypothetical protein E7373_00935 [Clostridiales bacterium]|nr:hypothetical protein [Clostridiales bacterium]
MCNNITGEDIINFLIGLTDKSIQRDIILNGNPKKIVKKVASVFLLTIDVMNKCIEENVDMIIVHEGAFYHEPKYIDLLQDEIALRKNDLLKKSDILIYRFHDVAHYVFPDIILKGFLNEVELGFNADDCYMLSFGSKGIMLKDSLSIKYIISEIKQKLKLEKVRFFGDINNKVRCIHFGLGQCLTDYNSLSKTECELYICGEVYDLPSGSYCADAKALGLNKNIIALGHYSSEFLGMKYFAEFLANKFNNLQVDYVDCGEFFEFI